MSRRRPLLIGPRRGGPAGRLSAIIPLSLARSFGAGGLFAFTHIVAAANDGDVMV